LLQVFISIKLMLLVRLRPVRWCWWN